MAKAVPVQVRPWAPYQRPVVITGDLKAPFIGVFFVVETEAISIAATKPLALNSLSIELSAAALPLNHLRLTFVCDKACRESI